jgi:ADP-ribose pyrophosphatase YjhB (NUDIX family)
MNTTFFTPREVLELIDQNTGVNPNRSDERAFLFYSGLIYPRFNEQTLGIEFLTLDYKERGTGINQKKFPGGTSQLGETAIEAAIRESGEEVGHKPAKDSLWLIHNKQIPTRSTGKIGHIKCFFLVKSIGATIKTKTGTDEGETSPVQWTSIHDLILPQEMGGLFKNHRQALFKSCEKLAKENTSYRYLLRRAIEIGEFEENC